VKHQRTFLNLNLANALPGPELECAHDELGSGIRALDDQNRELTVDNRPRTRGHAEITATRADAPTPPPRSLP
jgi:hypothetical protein